MNYLRPMVTTFFILSCQAFAEENTNALDGGQHQSEESKPIVNQKQPAITETVLGMNVSANKESPNILYIVPWKSDANASKPMQVSKLVNEIYQPLDPEAFSKQVEFYSEIVNLPQSEID